MNIVSDLHLSKNLKLVLSIILKLQQILLIWQSLNELLFIFAVLQRTNNFIKLNNRFFIENYIQTSSKLFSKR